MKTPTQHGKPWYLDFLFVLAVLVIFALTEARLAVGGENHFEHTKFFTLKSLAFMLFAAAPLLMLPEGWSRRYSCTVIPLVLAATAAQIILLLFYILPVEKSLIAILTLSPGGEYLEFIRSVLPSRVGGAVLLAVVLIIATAVLSCRLKTAPDRAGRWLGAAAMLPFLAGAGIYAGRGEIREAFNFTTLTRLGVAAVDYRNSLRDYVEMAAAPEVPPGLRRLDDSNLLGVIVIGESAGRRHHSLFGYRRETTPQLEYFRKFGSLAAFGNVWSPSVHTATSLPYSFSFATLDEPRRKPGISLCDLYRRAGFRTVLISNQLRHGQFDTPASLMFRNADRAVYVRELEPGPPDDAKLLEYLETELVAEPVPTIVFLHLMGSHTPFEQRCPPGEKRFTAADDPPESYTSERFRNMANAYDNSIAYTDQLLGRLIRRLDRGNRPAFMVYFSDHGEAVYPEMTEWIARDASRVECYEVPLAVWLSNSYIGSRRGFIDTLRRNAFQPFQTDRLIYALLDLARITYEGFPSTENLFSVTYRPRPRFLRNGTQPERALPPPDGL